MIARTLLDAVSCDLAVFRRKISGETLHLLADIFELGVFSSLHSVLLYAIGIIYSLLY